MSNTKMPPAFLLYVNDYRSGTIDFNWEQKGKYIELLLRQYSKGGYLQEKEIKRILDFSDEDDIEVLEKFKHDEKGYFNVRLIEEIEKRKAYSESRSANRKGKKKVVPSKKNISKTYDKHMENENKDENINENKKEDIIEIKKGTKETTEKTTRKKKSFTPPTLSEVEAYCKERNNNVVPKAFYDYFTAGKWIDSKGQEVKSWKQKIITWESYHKMPTISKKQNIKNQTLQEEIESDLEKTREFMETKEIIL